MRLLFESLDPVFISYVRNILEQEDIKTFIFDENISMIEGSIGAFQRRIMVIDDEYEEAHKVYLSLAEQYNQ
ncbi:MAG: DUF2007 domain-containing protein [Hyphomicrobiales bacterium]